MRWLKAVIARLSGLARRLISTASSTPAVGPALPAPTTKRGRASSATGSPRRPPARTAPSPSREPARQTRSAPKRGSASKTAPPPQAPLSIVAGSRSAAPVSPLRQLASPVVKPVKAAAQYTPPEQSRLREQAPAQTPTASLSGARGKRKAAASLTPQPASPAAKAKQKPAAPTKAASKATPAKAPARTRTAKPSGEHGR